MKTLKSILTKWETMTEFERMVAEDMVKQGYDYLDPADIQEFWRELITTWTE